MSRFFRIFAANRQRSRNGQTPPANAVLDRAGESPVAAELHDNRATLARITENCSDVVFRELTIGPPPGLPALLVYLDGLTENSILNTHILAALMKDSRLLAPDGPLPPAETFRLLMTSTVSVGNVQVSASMRTAVYWLFSGHALLFLDGLGQAMILETRAFEQRSVAEPDTEAVVRGPREGFIEDISVNLSMLRRKIRNSHLKFERMILGRRSQTTVAIAYVDDVVDPGIVAEVKRRLLRIDTDAVLESGYLEALIEDAPLSPFFTIANTERPDNAAAKILEGRVAIFTDGTPFVLTVPTLFFEAFGAAEDAYSRFPFTSLTRLIRHGAFFVSLFLPSAYVAIQTFHNELLPTGLAVAMAADRAVVPFPAAVEALLMLVIFDVLREAGVRMPRPVGQAVAIVGTLVLGDAAIQSRLISPAMVMVIAVTGITSFVLPPQTGTLGVLKYPVLLLSGTFGLFGTMLAYVGMLIHLSSLRSFGSPFLSPLGPIDWTSWRDVFVRAPQWMLDERPEALHPQDRRRQARDLKPGPDQPRTQRSRKEAP